MMPNHQLERRGVWSVGQAPSIFMMLWRSRGGACLIFCNMKKYSLLLVFCLHLSSSGAQGMTADLSVSVCEEMVGRIYEGRLPLSLPKDGVLRGWVECIVGFSKPAQIVHHDLVLAQFSPEDRQRMRKRMQVEGPSNPAVQMLCADARFGFLLQFVDMAYRYYQANELIGEVLVSSDMCRLVRMEKRLAE